MCIIPQHTLYLLPDHVKIDELSDHCEPLSAADSLRFWQNNGPMVCNLNIHLRLFYCDKIFPEAGGATLRSVLIVASCEPFEDSRKI
jgi:hypothetical protein